MSNPWIPRILLPDYTWPRPIAPVISNQTPPIPRVSRPLVRRFWGVIHNLLARFSQLYCSWTGVPFVGQVMDLPFGLVLKWTERVRIEEVIAMQMARAAGMPVPRVLCYGERPGSWHPVSILMTRLPGCELHNSFDQQLLDEGDPFFEELWRCLDAMRTWKSPFGKSICSVLGTSISSQRVPNHSMGPVDSEERLHEYLLGPASRRGFESTEDYDKALVKAKSISAIPHRVVFTHGDFKSHNLLVDDEGHLSGFLDWESAGWCPEYWEFTTAMRFGRDSWWYQVASSLGGDQYLTELECDVALNSLTVDSYIGM